MFSQLLVCYLFIFYLFHTLNSFVIVFHKYWRFLVLHIVPHLLVGFNLWVSEECHRGSPAESAVGNFFLSGQVLCIFYWRNHFIHCEKCCQVGGVRAYDNESEKPPDGSNYSSASSLKMRTLFFCHNFRIFFNYLKSSHKMFEINEQIEWTNLGIEPRSLSEESSSNEPKAVVDAKLIFHYVILNHARMRVVPLIWRESCHNK